MELRDETIFYDISTTKGLSGSPVYIKDSKRLVGIHKGTLYSQGRCTLITKELID